MIISQLIFLAPFLSILISIIYVSIFGEIWEDKNVGNEFLVIFPFVCLFMGVTWFRRVYKSNKENRQERRKNQ